MNEIEVKILNIDVEKIRAKLIELGAVLVKNEIQINYMFDFPGDTLFKNYKGYCRIREIHSLLDGSKKYILAIKKMKSQGEFKEMVEEETEIINFESAKRILLELGLYNRAIDRKRRESYTLNNVLYEFDEWDKDVYPNPYLEIEANSKESLRKGIELIGYKLEDATSKSLAELRQELKLK